MNPSKPQRCLRISVSVSWLPQPATPLLGLNEDITVSAPASTAALKGGRYMFQSRCVDMSVVLYSRPPSGWPYAAQCFGLVTTLCGALSSLPCAPRTRAAAIADPRYGSSPAPSAI